MSDDGSADGSADAAAFNIAMIDLYQTAKRDLGYNATRFIQMVSEHGGVATARNLIDAPTPSEGFTTLWENGRLDLSVEAHVLKPEFEGLFTSRERRIAERRLADYGYPVSPTPGAPAS